MKLLKSSLFTLFLISNAALGVASGQEIPHPGPRSPEEPKFLFTEAQNELSRKNVPAAIKNLERLLRRYPRDPQALKAQEQLVGLYLQQKNATAAIRASKAYLHLDSTSESAQGVRAKLVEAYFLQGKHTLARATAKELLAKSTTEATQARALLTLARIDAQEKKWNKARARLDALPAQAAIQEKASLLLEIGVKECQEAKPPSKKVKQDDPWIEYFDRKNFCLKTVVAGHGNTSSSASHGTWCDAFRSLNAALEASRINAYQKSRLAAELDKTRDLATPLECEAAKRDGP